MCRSCRGAQRLTAVHPNARHQLSQAITVPAPVPEARAPGHNSTQCAQCPPPTPSAAAPAPQRGRCTRPAQPRQSLRPSPPATAPLHNPGRARPVSLQSWRCGAHTVSRQLSVLTVAGGRQSWRQPLPPAQQQTLQGSSNCWMHKSVTAKQSCHTPCARHLQTADWRTHGCAAPCGSWRNTWNKQRRCWRRAAWRLAPRGTLARWRGGGDCQRRTPRPAHPPPSARKALATLLRWAGSAHAPCRTGAAAWRSHQQMTLPAGPPEGRGCALWGRVPMRLVGHLHLTTPSMVSRRSHQI